MKHLRTSKRTSGRSAPRHPGAVDRGPDGPDLEGKGVGEHLGCSPCGRVAGRARCGIGGPGPEVLLSLLPIANFQLYLERVISRPAQAGLELNLPRVQGLEALPGVGIFGRQRRHLIFHGLHLVEVHAGNDVP